MIKFLKQLKSYWLLILLTVIFVYIQAQVDLALPTYMAKIINEGVINENIDFIRSTGYEMLGISLIGGFFTIISSFLIAKISSGYGKDIRERVFRKVEEFSLSEINKFSISSLITRCTNDIQQIQSVIGNFLRPMLFAPIIGIGAIIKAYNSAPSMSWIIGLAVFVILSIVIFTVIIALPKFKILQTLTDKLNLVTRENLTGIRVIRAFNKEKYQEEKFDTVSKSVVKTSLFVNRVMVILQPLMMFIFNVASIAIIWFGANLIAESDLQIGDLMAFMQYSMQVIMSFLMISMMFIFIPRSIVSVKRVNEILNTDIKVENPQLPKIIDNLKGNIEFKNASFAYEGAKEPVVKNISLEINSNETTAIIGGTGSGKTTLINLIPRFYDVTEGEILIDGVNIKKMDQKYLRSLIGLATQKAVVFSGTIGSNIKFGNQTNSLKINKSAEIAQATEFIQELPEKFDATTAQSGSNFSGGQKQRLSIARAINNNSQILIFDDTFSALDFKTDAKLRESLKKELKNKTIILVSQRIGTIIDADKIVVLSEEGEIAGVGKHEDLMQNCQIYKEIANSQLSKEDLSNMKFLNQ